MKARLAIVIPSYNEEEVLPESSRQLIKLLTQLKEKQRIAPDSILLFIDDGSQDKTWPLIQEAHRNNRDVCGMKLAKNAGHQNALLAGLMRIKSMVDITISIDADLQDDISVIEEMIDKYYQGNEIVFGVRNDRSSDTWFKRSSAGAFYRIMEWLGASTVKNHADFRLMSRKALDALEQFKERNLFLRGIVTCLGFQTAEVYYTRKKRTAGETKYPLRKMISFALQGITSFSIRPMHLISAVGVCSILISFVSIIYSLVGHFTGNTISGWTSIFCSMWFLGGMILLALGIIGQYIGNIYMEVKERPRYIIETELFSKDEVSPDSL
ncbi:MAG: glycosyltransferase family 2 protein [Lachnospiraceae bacterium]|nr:glycosyltransferase family 2 protein [Lachnospiraceae bacterium]